MEARELHALKHLLRHALNKKQILILQAVSSSPPQNITRLLQRLSEEKGIPLSTLKTHTRMLRDLGLIEYSYRRPVRLTRAGVLVLEIVGSGVR